MSVTIVNAAPIFYPLGTNDLSMESVPREREAIPSHLPKVFIYAKKGPKTPVLVGGADRLQIFGSDSFDPLKKWCNHQTILSNRLVSKANAQMIQRIIPTDAGPEANFLLSLDVLPTAVNDYVRSSDGSISTDVNGDPIVKLDPIGEPITVPGFKVKWVVTVLNTTLALQNLGNAVITPGDQTNVLTSTQSQRYPVLQFKATSAGEDGNNAGIRLWAPTSKSGTPIDTRVLERGGYYPYRLSVIRRPDAMSTSKVVESISGEQYVDIGLSPEKTDPITTAPVYIGDSRAYLDKYQNLSDARYPAQYGDFDTVVVYDENIKTLIDLFYAAESQYHQTNAITDTDFKYRVGEEFLFNIVNGTTSSGTPYYTYQFADGVRLNEYTNIYAGGSSDGTMSNQLFATEVGNIVREYNNPNSPLMEDAYHVESIIYDTGFPLQTKYDLLNFIAIRKDTNVVLCTYEDGGPKMTANQESSLALALRTRARMFPESEYFGTGVFRCLIMGRDGKLRTDNWIKRVPVVMELASKAAGYMGAGNGIWNGVEAFDGEEGAIINDMYDINVTYTPPAARMRDWDNGLNWVSRLDRGAFNIPALKTVYDNDTSVCTGWLLALAIGEINKVTARAHRYYNGTQRYTNAQLAIRVDEYITNKLLGRFDNRFTIKVKTYYTYLDEKRGYSWTTKVMIGAPNMKTVMTAYVEAYRKDKLISMISI